MQTRYTSPEWGKSICMHVSSFIESGNETSLQREMAALGQADCWIVRTASADRPYQAAIRRSLLSGRPGYLGVERCRKFQACGALAFLVLFLARPNEVSTRLPLRRRPVIQTPAKIAVSPSNTHTQRLVSRLPPHALCPPANA
jgi:hypothetical protein